MVSLGTTWSDTVCFRFAAVAVVVWAHTHADLVVLVELVAMVLDVEAQLEVPVVESFRRLHP